MITKADAEKLLEALQRIEEGNTYIGAIILREFLRNAGHPAPMVVINGRDYEREGKGRQP
jgi:hypothetical protein